MDRISLASLLLLLLMGCKSDDEHTAPAAVVPADYRDPVVGQFYGTYNQYTWTMGNPPFIYDTTWNYGFSVVKDTAFNSVIANGDVFVLDSTLACYESPYPGQIRSFSFHGDTVTLYYRSGGLGGYSTTTISGVKQ